MVFANETAWNDRAKVCGLIGAQIKESKLHRWIKFVFSFVYHFFAEQSIIQQPFWQELDAGASKASALASFSAEYGCDAAG
jgi:hypothetical protein